MPEINTLARKLKTIRKEMHQSQMDFAANCGISKETLSLMEREQGDPRLSTLQKVAAYSDRPVAKLLEIEEEGKV